MYHPKRDVPCIRSRYLLALPFGTPHGQRAHTQLSRTNENEGCGDDYPFLSMPRNLHDARDRDFGLETPHSMHRRLFVFLEGVTSHGREHGQ